MRLLSKPFPPRAGGFLALVMIVLLTFPATQPLHAKTLSTTAPTLAPFEAAPLSIGVSWYPEQWPESQWEADLALMRRAGVSVVRLGEFAWARLEPRDGEFDFGWIDRAVALAGRHGIRVVLGTPTAAPPVWLTEAHPDVLRVNEDGSVEGHGERRQFSFASATYRRYTVRIAGEMARRYGRNPDVVGWQIDNEIGVPSFDREAKARWARWLTARYGTVEELNRRWTTDYWSQRYQRFDQVPLKSKGPQNPALLLDFKRFASFLWAEYVDEQAAAIRTHADRRQFVTTNSTAWNNNFDQYLVHRGLDLAAWDDYVPNGRPDWTANALHHDVVRGYRQRNFWIMETQPGRVDWGALNRSLDPGQTRELAWQAVGRGADAILYWQWRSALNGQEQYHGTLVGPDGQPMPVFDEIARTAREMAAMSRWLKDTQPEKAEVALLYSQESRWAIEAERHSRDYDPVATITDWYRPFADDGYRVDVLPPDADLAGYRLVVAPNLTILSGDTAERLKAYVERGGHLVLGPRSGMKDGDNALWPMRQPGPLGTSLGGRVGYYYPLDGPVAMSAIFGDTTAHIWGEVLEPVADDTKVLGRFGSDQGWLSGQPALLRRKVGRGSIAYLGAILDQQGQGRFTRWMITEAAVPRPLMTPVDGVEFMTRARGAERFIIAVNHGETAKRISLPAGAGWLHSDDVQGDMLRPHGVALAHVKHGTR